MNTQAMAQAVQFIPRTQAAVIRDLLNGEENKYFVERFHALAHTIETMPVTYEQDGKGDNAVAYLHYFTGSCDWWITEKDIDGGVKQAFGLVRLNGGDYELGYISIEELTCIPLVEIDLHFNPTSIGEIKGA